MKFTTAFFTINSYNNTLIVTEITLIHIISLFFTLCRWHGPGVTITNATFTQNIKFIIKRISEKLSKLFLLFSHDLNLNLYFSWKWQIK